MNKRFFDGGGLLGRCFYAPSALWVEGIHSSLFTKGDFMRRLDGFKIIKVVGLSLLVGLAGYAAPSTGVLSLSYAEEPQAQEGQEDVTERGFDMKKFQQQVPTGGKLKLILGPDLKPFPKGNASCPRADGKLHFSVKNVGDKSARASIALWSGNVPVGIRMKALAPGESQDISVNIPRGCYNPDCGWSLTMDIGYEVREHNEKNNKISGTCIG